MAQIGNLTMTVNVKVVGSGGSALGRRILGMVARIFKIKLELVKESEDIK